MAKVTIIGAGAMGSVYAGLMQYAGHEVHGVTLWEDHINAVNANGLRVHGISGDRTVRLASMSASTEGIGRSDLVVIATKSFDVEAAAASARGLIGPGTVVQTIQNGLGSADRVAAIIGSDRLAIGVVGGFGASVPEPGVAHHNGMEMIRFGSYRELPREDLAAGAQVWESAGFTTRLFDDTAQMVWEKLIMNVAFSGTCCLTGMTIGQVIADPDAWRVASACSAEAVAVASAAEVTLDVGDPIRHVRTLGGKIPDARPSMLIDASLRRRSEVDAINGSISTFGERLGVPTPTNDVVVALIKARESTYL
ncbi:2-dehydropantoate 2-reductase [Saxibacter everestensis]|uniref:2-dehydropantoate 2-reductase n=1 Tax=Saxibacter everestensis TaxID=2909229 RepID=A0ABY8QR40_9MICO|nr:2-dehydropantoate 2-reductase [Brevibacteriaceae bacterium ZFBP1038]